MLSVICFYKEARKGEGPAGQAHVPAPAPAQVPRQRKPPKHKTEEYRNFRRESRSKAKAAKRARRLAKKLRATQLRDYWRRSRAANDDIPFKLAAQSYKNASYTLLPLSKWTAKHIAIDTSALRVSFAIPYLPYCHFSPGDLRLLLLLHGPFQKKGTKCTSLRQEVDFSICSLWHQCHSIMSYPIQDDLKPCRMEFFILYTCCQLWHIESLGNDLTLLTWLSQMQSCWRW